MVPLPTEALKLVLDMITGDKPFNLMQALSAALDLAKYLTTMFGDVSAQSVANEAAYSDYSDVEIIKLAVVKMDDDVSALSIAIPTGVLYSLALKAILRWLASRA